MRVSYIAHPIGGDVENNLKKIYMIIRQINLEEPDVVPFAPYIGDCLALNDSKPEERNRGIKNNQALFEAWFIHEVRLYGDRISNGMEQEILAARKLLIPVRAMTGPTILEYRERFIKDLV